MEQEADSQPETALEQGTNGSRASALSLAERVERLERELFDLRREWQALQMDWEDYYEKFRNLYSRLNRRTEREKAAPEEQPLNPAALALLQTRGSK